MRTSSKYFLLTCLYLSQGLPYGFFQKALPVMMRKMEASLPEISLASLVTLPWALKFLWAPLVDKYGSKRIGRKRSWIFFLQMCALSLFIFLGLTADPKDYRFLIWGFLLASLISATQDIATDGLAVGLLSEPERGLGNGIQVAGYRLGMILGGGFMLMILDLIQWQGAFYLMGLGLCLATIPLFFYKEPFPPPAVEALPLRALYRRIISRPHFLVWLAVIGFYKFGDAMTSQMLGPFMVDLEMSWQEIGRIWGIFASISGLLGALAGGWLVRPMGRYRAIVWFGFIQAMPILGYMLMAQGILAQNQLPLVISLEHFTGGLATTALFTAMMDVCDPHQGSTDYTLQACAVVIFTTLAHWLSGSVAEALGHAGNFFISFLVCLMGAVVFTFMYRTQTKERGGFLLTDGIS